MLFKLFMFFKLLLFVFALDLSRGLDVEKLMWDPKSQTIPDKTTVVMLGYSIKRFKNLKKILPNYVNYSNTIDKIVFIWNNPKENPPDFPKGVVPIELYYRNNSLNNRYNINDYKVKTKTVLTLDDDVLLNSSLIREMIELQKVNPDRLIGSNLRSAQNGNYLFSNKPPRLAIGQSLIWRLTFGEWYSNDQFIQKSNNEADYIGCDDIAINALIQYRTGKDAISVSKKGRLHLLSFIDGLSMKKHWLKKRDRCVKYYGRHFNLTNWL